MISTLQNNFAKYVAFADHNYTTGITLGAFGIMFMLMLHNKDFEE